jgi:hypothetical protein
LRITIQRQQELLSLGSDARFDPESLHIFLEYAPVKATSMKNAGFALACEKILAESLADVATELRLVNVIDLIGYVQGQHCANLEDLINSSAELYFRHGALRYAWSADLEVVWDSSPTISLNMEFCWSGVTAFFNLCLYAARAGVDLQHLTFDGALDESCPDAAERLNRFSRALADSRLTPPRRPPSGLISNHANW